MMFGLLASLAILFGSVALGVTAALIEKENEESEDY